MFNGVPFDLAFQIDGPTRAGWAVIFSGFHGRKFDWRTMDFVEGK